MNKVNRWADNHRQTMAEFLARVLDMDVDTVAATENQRVYEGVKPIDDNVLSEQQRIADTLVLTQLLLSKLSSHRILSRY